MVTSPVGLFDPADRDMIIRTVIGESDDQPPAGQAAVAHAILNRVKDGSWGDTPSKVVLARGQFEPWQTRARELNRINPKSDRYQKTAAIVDDVISGKTPDPTGGATHFLDPAVVRRRRGGSLPDWASGNGVAIGDHTFYRPGPQVAQNATTGSATDAPDPLGHLDWGTPGAAAAADPLGHLDWGGSGVVPKPGAGITTAPSTRTKVTNPGTMQVTEDGKVKYVPGEVQTPADIAEATRRGLPGQFVTGMPVVGPAANMIEAAIRASTRLPGESDKDFSARYRSRLEEITRGDRAMANEAPLPSALAQAAGGASVYGAAGLIPLGRLLMGAAGPSPAARIYGGTAGGAGVNAIDALMRGEDPVAGAAIGAAGGFAGPTIGEGLGNASRFGLNRWAGSGMPIARAGRYGVDLLTQRGIADYSAAEIAQMRATAGPHAMLGDVTPGLRDITQGVAGTQSEGRDIVRRAYEQRHLAGPGRLDDILNRHIGPSNNIVDYVHLLEQEQARLSTPLYNQFRKTPVPFTPELEALLPRLRSARAFTLAKEIAEVRGTNWTQTLHSFNPQTGKANPSVTYPTTESWDLIKRGLDRRIDTAYRAGDNTMGRELVALKRDLISAIDKSPAGNVYRQARETFADHQHLIDQVRAGSDTLHTGRRGTTADELREEWRGLSTPERAARLVGVRAALHEDMSLGGTSAARTTGDSGLLSPRNREKLGIMMGQPQADAMIRELEQEQFLRSRLPYVMENPNTGASNVTRSEATRMFTSPEPPTWELTRPSTYPMVGRLMPMNVLHDVMVAGRARAAPGLAPILTSTGPELDENLRDMIRSRARTNASAGASRLLDRTVASGVAGPATSVYRRKTENDRKSAEERR